MGYEYGYSGRKSENCINWDDEDIINDNNTLIKYVYESKYIHTYIKML